MTVASARRTALVAGAAAAATLVAFALALLWARWVLARPYAGWSGTRTVVELPPGTSASEALDRLHEAGVIEHPTLTRWWLRLSGDARAIQAGEYEFFAAASAKDVVGRLLAGDVVLHTVTVPEGLTLADTAARIAAAGFGPEDALVRRFRDPTPILGFDPDAPDLEGYLFPDTYHLPRGTPPVVLVEAMVGRFLAVVGDDYAARAEAVGLTPREAVTLASMIEEETSLPGERPRISRVFHNRIERGMKMQCDPTVRYALERDGRSVRRLTRNDLRYDSPWNTYVVDGLPPGPISSPGAASLDAAVAPADGDELYFVAAPDGGHAFSRTLDAHLRAVARWRAYVRSSR